MPTRPSDCRLILVVGGASSGKSAEALRLAGGARPRVFVATGQALDAEMAERIRRHQLSRGSQWETVEVPVELVTWFTDQAGRYATILVDCITLWLSNLRAEHRSDGDIFRLVSRLVKSMRALESRIVVVTNELGLGLVPVDADSRSFRTLAGQVNEQLAREADEAYFVVSGLPLRLK